MCSYCCTGVTSARVYMHVCAIVRLSGSGQFTRKKLLSKEERYTETGRTIAIVQHNTYKYCKPAFLCVYVAL